MAHATVPAWRLAAASRVRSLLTSIALVRARRERDLILLFCCAWLATALPLAPHRVPTLWLWGALSGACLVTTWLVQHRSRRRHAIWSLLGCSALIGIASFCDFWRRSPVFLLSQCRSSADDALFTGIWRHMAFHWQWFPVTTIAMLLWISLASQAAPEARKAAVLCRDGVGWRVNILRKLRTQILPRLARGFFMFFCMGLTMSGIEALGVLVQGELSADGFVCAMLCGMSLYHLLVHFKFWRSRNEWNRPIPTLH